MIIAVGVKLGDFAAMGTVSPSMGPDVRSGRMRVEPAGDDLRDGSIGQGRHTALAGFARLLRGGGPLECNIGELS